MKIITKVGAAGSQSGSRRWPSHLPGVRNLFITASAVLVLVCCASWTAEAAALPRNDDAADAGQKAPGARAVRLSTVDGQVRVVQDGQIIADPATANLPLFEGSQIATGNDGRAEIQLEDGSIARLSPNSTLTFSVLQQQGTSTHTEVVLNGGLAYFELQPSNAEHNLRVNYGSATFSASSFSVVRVTEDQPPGELAVFSGNVHLERGDSLRLDIHGGESLSLDASDATRYNLAETIEQDSWDSWNADRDQALTSESAERTAASNSYTNSQGVGMSDLDAYGNWYNVPGQGYIWSPYDAQALGASWDPYGYGQWVYYPSYGFLWVSGYGWGYAPYQCGLWNYYDGFGWGWAPGGVCNPWWGGYGGWGYNIGNPPHGYRPPRRPLPGPHPIRPIHPLAPGKQTLLASRVIPVDNRPVKTNNPAIYGHPAQPVVIAGHAVQPLQPVAPRPTYARSTTAIESRAGMGFTGSSAHPVYTGNSPVSGARPIMPSSHPQPAPSYHPTYSGGGGGGVSHPASAPMGGGGGGGHAGGGGGGGGTHK